MLQMEPLPGALLEFETRHALAKPTIPGPQSLNCKEIVESSGLPFLPLVGFESAPLGEMLSEVTKLKNRFIDHRGQDYGVGWKSLTVHGLEWDKTEGMERYGLDPNDLSNYRWTEVAEELPTLVQFLKSNFRYTFYHRIRVMLLEPGGYIAPHFDSRKYLLDPVNFALSNPKGCDFIFEEWGKVPFEKYKFNKLSVNTNHIVINRSALPRFHVIVHGRPDWTYWNPIIEQSYQNFRLAMAREIP